jgi:purine-binding chemotaxis protein CheW
MQNLSQENPANLDLITLFDLTELADSIFLEAPHLAPPAGEKYVVFVLDEEFYAVRAEIVVEVLSPLPVTPLPNVPEWLCGVTNLRGDIVSVVDLRKFWRKNSEAPAKNKFVVLRSEKTETAIAFLVDRFSEIVSLAPQDIKFSAADYENSFPTLFGKAAGKTGDLLLIDTEKLLASLNFSENQTQ